jgi:hypothetical protein
MADSGQRIAAREIVSVVLSTQQWMKPNRPIKVVDRTITESDIL